MPALQHCPARVQWVGATAGVVLSSQLEEHTSPADKSSTFESITVKGGGWGLMRGKVEKL